MPKDGIANDWWRIYTLLQTSLSVGPGVLMEFNRLVDLVTETNGDLQWGWHCKEEMWRADMLLLPWFPYLCMACTLNVGCWKPLPSVGAEWETQFLTAAAWILISPGAALQLWEQHCCSSWVSTGSLSKYHWLFLKSDITSKNEMALSHHGDNEIIPTVLFINSHFIQWLLRG